MAHDDVPPLQPQPPTRPQLVAVAAEGPGLHESMRETLRRTPTAQGVGLRRYLLVLAGASSSFFDLPESGEVLIGRGSEAALRLADGVASRRHARITIGPTVHIEDLGSSNGTQVNGEPLRGQRPLRSGDAVTIGDVTLIYTGGRGPAPPPRLSPAPAFAQRLDEEVARALRFQRPLALFALFPVFGDQPAGLAATLTPLLRPADLLGAQDDGALLLRPECDAVAAPRLAATLLRALVGRARVGFSVCPQDGCDPDTLVSAARAAARSASEGKSAAASESATRLNLEGRTILIADPAMARLFDLIRRLSQSDLPVLISGETGVGKENAAFAVHHYSPRQKRPFVAINCAAIHQSLVEAELFGHERGAFSGAVAARAGLFETASGGTVFLDEVGELPLSVQAKLLRVLELKRITRVGEVREREVDIRIVAATNRDLEREVREGRFRQDLFFRLSAATVILPPLRERPREIPLLARAFLLAASQRLSREAPELSAATLQRLASYAFPGNVRELRNAMDFVAATVEDAAIEPWHLPDALARATPPGDPEPPEDDGQGDAADAAPESPPADSAERRGAPSDSAEQRGAPSDSAEQRGAPSDSAEQRGAPSINAPPTPGRPRRFRPVAEELRELERRRMIEALAEARGVRRRAAELISMPIRTFNLKMRQYDIR